MNSEVLANINKIIERDSKSTTYKFALLRGTIDIIQENNPYIAVSEGTVAIPLGLLIEKWMVYYYPILDAKNRIPQINGSANLAFADKLQAIIRYYTPLGGIGAFYNDLRNNGIPNAIAPEFVLLVKQLKQTITQMPMKYIGRSISNDYYSIFKYKLGKSAPSPAKLDLAYLIDSCGLFYIPYDYYDAFKLLGSFITGQDSILFQWAQFSVNAAQQSLPIEQVISEVLKSPITERDIQESKKLYKSILQKDGKVHCVWTGKAITQYDIDHMIPFSVWKNNDLWNLLPAQATVNNQKRDKIPSAQLIEKQRSLIVHYWSLFNEAYTHRFQKEIQISLLGNNTSDSWETAAISQLQNSCDYLVSQRGFQEWSI